MKPIIRIDNLSKQYRLGARPRSAGTLGAAIGGALRAPLGRLARARDGAGELLWALRDVSFDVNPGEIVGIIGRNGAGKSTLLKILSRITEPTRGRIELYGRASSLLEVGTGFHPELSGRENVYLNGAILGLRRGEIKRRFDEIIAFAEVEKFVDTPVKHYSSGMYMRLAFAVAAHLEPEILIVDEVLSVGDAQFQRKCLGKMGDVAKAGRTVLFVSHNLAAVQNLCGRGVVLEQGRMTCLGTQSEAIARYLASNGGHAASLRERTDRTGSGGVRVVAIEMRDANNKTLDTASSGQDIDIYLHYETAPGFRRSDVLAGLIVRTAMDVPVFLQHNRLTRDEWGTLPPKGAFVCRLRRLPLPPSTFRLGYSLICEGAYLDMIDDAFELIVAAGDFYGSGEVPPVTHGCCLVDAAWRLDGEASPPREVEVRQEVAEAYP